MPRKKRGGSGIRPQPRKASSSASPSTTAGATPSSEPGDTPATAEPDTPATVLGDFPTATQAHDIARPRPTMAPNPLETVDDNIKKTIQSLYAIQSSTHGYLGSETQSALVAEIQSLSRSLSNLQDLSHVPQGSQGQAGASASATSLSEALLPPEVIDYVDSGRNPHIYTREFVELVQRGNSYLKGKGEALTAFRDALAEEMRAEWPEMTADVDKAVGKR